MDDLRRFVENDAFARHLGVEMLHYGDGRASARMEITARHLNSAGCVHGGAIFSLADATFSAAANSHGRLALAIDVSIAFFEAVREGVLTAEAREVALNAKLGTYLIDVKDQAGRLVAQFRGTVYRKRAGIADVAG
ncbi:MAG: hotdog fold thioesterase [Thermoleophilia bacterium]